MTQKIIKISGYFLLVIISLFITQVTAEEQAIAVISSNEVSLPILYSNSFFHLVRTPCGDSRFINSGRTFSNVEVLIDPGHGGKRYPGSVGKMGTRESDINLILAKELSSILEEKGVSSLLTRTKDYELPIYSRAFFANQIQPKLFLSLHFNGVPNKTNSKSPGTEIFYQSNSINSERAATLIYFSTFDKLKDFNNDINFWYGSKYPGARKVNITRSNIDYYGVLRNTNGFRESKPVPTVLLEVGFLSNPEEENLYSNSDNLKTIAEGISRGVLSYLLGSESKVEYIKPTTYANRSTHSSGIISNCVDTKI